MADIDHEAAQRARLQQWPRECGCDQDVLRCAHLGSMFVKIRQHEDHFDVLMEVDSRVSCYDPTSGLRHTSRSDADEVYELFEEGMRHV